MVVDVLMGFLSALCFFFGGGFSISASNMENPRFQVFLYAVSFILVCAGVLIL